MQRRRRLVAAATQSPGSAAPASGSELLLLWLDQFGVSSLRVRGLGQLLHPLGGIVLHLLSLKFVDRLATIYGQVVSYLREHALGIPRLGGA